MQECELMLLIQIVIGGDVGERNFNMMIIVICNI